MSDVNNGRSIDEINGDDAGQVSLEFASDPVPANAKYYIFTWAAAANENDPSQQDIAVHVGAALQALQLELLFAWSYISPVMIRSDLLAIHEVWAMMSPPRRNQIREISPALASALNLALIGEVGHDHQDHAEASSDQASPAEVVDDPPTQADHEPKDWL